MYLLALADRQATRHRVDIAIGREDGTARAPCRVHRVPALASAGPAPARAALDAVARAVRPDVVHVHNVVNPDALAWAADRGAVMTVQDHRTFCPGRGKWRADGAVCRDAMAPDVCAGCFDDPHYFARIGAITAARLAHVRRMARAIVLSEYMRAELAAAGVPRDRIEVVPPFVWGIDPAAPATHPPCVLVPGRLVAAKGVWDAVDAWRRSGVRWPLVAAGTGRERAALEAAGVRVVGWVPHADMAGVYRSARVVVFAPRWQEPFGIAGLEALWCGVPVAAWESGGVRQWHPGPLAPWGDVDALAALIAALDGTRPSPPRVPADEAALLDRLDAIYAAAAGR